VLELLGQDWHQPALVEARPNPTRDPLERQPNVDDGNGEVHPSAPAAAPYVPPAQPPAAGPTIRRSTSSPREFEW
jgi:hypothetical protein